MLFALAACQSPSVGPPPSTTQAPTPSPAEPAAPVDAEGAEIKVGLLLPLTGQHAGVGEALLNAAQLALFDIAGDQFALVVRDTGGTTQGAQTAMRAVLEEDVRLVLGPLFASSTAAAAGEARMAGVNVITFSNDRSVGGDGVYVMGLAPAPQVDRVVGYATSQGLRRFAVLAPSTGFGQAVVDAAQQAAIAYNGELARVVTYPPEATNLTEEVQTLADYPARHQALLAERQILSERGDAASRDALKALDGQDALGDPDFNAVILAEGGQRAQAIAPLMAYYDIDPQKIRYLGLAMWEDPRLSAEPTLIGGWFAAPPPELWTAFHQRYSASFGGLPPRIAAIAYDAAALAAVLATRARDEGRPVRYSADELTQPGGFSGIDGVFRLLPNGETERGLAVLELRPGGFRVIDEAPKSFQPLGS